MWFKQQLDVGESELTLQSENGSKKVGKSALAEASCDCPPASLQSVFLFVFLIILYGKTFQSCILATLSSLFLFRIHRQ